MLTLGNLVFGVMALGVIVDGAAMWKALALLSLSLVCDLLDGRMARRFGADGPMGAQLDSLADLISFGLVPAAALYTWSLAGAGALGMIACCALVAAAAWRLARFNVAAMLPAKKTDGPGTFTGIPVTIPAAIILGVAGGGFVVPQTVVVVGALVLAALMVSTRPFRSFKEKPLPFLAVPAVALLVADIIVFKGLAAGLGATMAIAGLVFIWAGMLQSLSRRPLAS